MKHSLITKISVFFVIAIILVCVLFITFARMQMNRALGSMQANQINAVNNLLELYKRNAPPSDIERYFSSYGLELVKDKNIIQNIITSGKIFFVQDTSIGEFSSVEYNNSLFLNIKNNSFVVVFEKIHHLIGYVSYVLPAVRYILRR